MADSDWRPAASLATLRRRAEIVDGVRAFFKTRAVLEVETPLLCRGTVTDLHLSSLRTGAQLPARLFLQTSPEFAMKRLLAGGSGPIFQICKAFREGEAGRRHNPEFTMLEWYRPGWDHHRLMDEVDALLKAVLGVPAARRVTCTELFADAAGVDVHRDDAARLKARCIELGVGGARELELDRTGWLSLIMTELVEPGLGRGRPTCVLDYPADQAALARVRAGDPPVAERFEVYVDGVELANGYHELTDPSEQRRRFDCDLAQRRDRGLEVPELDERLLAALEHGLPDSAGVAMGLDRLVMLATGAETIDEVIAFPIGRA
jgi:lysyl-tRNA synthetase class 2